MRSAVLKESELGRRDRERSKGVVFRTGNDRADRKATSKWCAARSASSLAISIVPSSTWPYVANFRQKSAQHDEKSRPVFCGCSHWQTLLQAYLPHQKTPTLCVRTVHTPHLGVAAQMARLQVMKEVVQYGGRVGGTLETCLQSR